MFYILSWPVILLKMQCFGIWIFFLDIVSRIHQFVLNNENIITFFHHRSYVVRNQLKIDFTQQSINFFWFHGYWWWLGEMLFITLKNIGANGWFRFLEPHSFQNYIIPSYNWCAFFDIQDGAWCPYWKLPMS